MAKGEQLVEGPWRIVETEMWDQEALDLVVPAHKREAPETRARLMRTTFSCARRRDCTPI